MKVLLSVSFVLCVFVVFGQKQITYEEMKSFEKANNATAYFDVYVAKDNHPYKVGDTLKIGKPTSEKNFAFINEWEHFPESGRVKIEASGTNTILKRIYVGGSRKAGFKIFFIGKGKCALCGPNYIDVEEALSSGELKSFGMSKEQAIAKLKEAKDLVDLGMMSKEDFDKLKAELSPIILKQ